jgi:ABC-2 type transport system permease protein
VTGALAALVRHSARRSRALLAATAALLVGFQALASLMAASFEESDSFAQIAAMVPDFLRQAFGASFLALLSFSGIVLLGFFHFAVVAFLVGLSVAIATEPASEVEHRFNDLLLARPLPRWVPIVRSAVFVAAVAIVMGGAMCAGTWTGLALSAPEGLRWPAPRLILSLGGLMAALMIGCGGLALAIGSAARRRGVAGAVAGLLLFALFLLDVVARVWQPARGLGRLSPFHYFEPIRLVGGQPLDWSQVAVLLGVGAAGMVVALFIYSRRDL